MFFNENMATKNVAVQDSKKKSTGSLLRISCGARVTSSKCARIMKTRSMAKAAARADYSWANYAAPTQTHRFQDAANVVLLNG